MMALKDGYGMLQCLKKNSIVITEDTYIFDKNHNKIALVKKNVLFNQVKCDVIISEKFIVKWQEMDQRLSL